MVATRVASRDMVAVRRRLALDITEAVRSWYRTKWGEPSRTANFRVGGLEVDVLKWRPDVTLEGVHLYATSGSSARSMPGADSKHRIEFILGLQPARDEVASPLAALALYPTREMVRLDHGHTVPASGPLWRGTEMRRFLVLRQIQPIIEPLALATGVHIEFLQAVPIFESELAYKVEFGLEDLLRFWRERGVRFWNSDRGPEQQLLAVK
jgi:Suppressor of fused protein (SUFU)